MKNDLIKFISKLITIILLLIFVIGCEPISVSVNSKGEVAFTRSEGVFFIDLKSGKLSLLDWNHGKESVPVIVRWSPEGNHLAFTVKENKDSQNTEVYIIDKKGGGKKKIYSTTKVITQMVISTKGTYISLAQAGENSDLNVADLVLINVKDGMSKIIHKDTGDVHSWLDDNTIAFMKINEKNPNNGDILKGELSLYKADSQKVESLVPVIVGKKGGMDCLSEEKVIAYTAIRTDKEKVDYEENMTADGYAYIYAMNSKKIEKVSDSVINYLEFSPDGKKLLAKAKAEGYGGEMNLVYIENNKTQKILVNKITDTVNANSSEVQAYPTWLNDKTALYWRLSNTYGSSGQALQLMSVDVSSMKKQNHQIMIESEIFDLVEKKGGY